MADGWRRWAMAIFPFAHRPMTGGGDRRGRPLMAKFATDSRDRRGRCAQLARPEQATGGDDVRSWRDRLTRPAGATVATDSRDRRGRRGQLTRQTATGDHWARFSDGVGNSSADRFQGDVGDRWGRCGDLADCATGRRGRPTRPTDWGDAWGQVGGGISRAAGAQPMPMAAVGQAGRGDAAKMPAPSNKQSRPRHRGSQGRDAGRVRLMAITAASRDKKCQSGA